MKILERNDGALIQIIYNSNSDLQVQVKGIILGQNDPIKLAHNFKVISNPQERYKWEVITFRGLGILAITLFPLIFMVSFSFLYPHMFLSLVVKKAKLLRNISLTFLLFGSFYLFTGIWVLIYCLPSSSPFDP